MADLEYNPERHFEFKSAAYRLFHFRYLISTQAINLRSDYDRNYRGFLVGDDFTSTEDMYEYEESSKITPWRMVEIHSKNGSITFGDIEDMVKVYSDIRQHLNDWFSAMYDVSKREECPIQDLEMMEYFARDLHVPVTLHNDGRIVGLTSLTNMLSLGRRRASRHGNKETTIVEGHRIDPFPSVVDRIQQFMAQDRFGLFAEENGDGY